MNQFCVTGCGRPTSNFLCPVCTTTLVTDLRSLVDGRDTTGRRIPGLLTELGVTLTRQTALGVKSGVLAHAATQPLPFDPRAADIGWDVANTIGTWTCDVAEHNPHLAMSADTVGGAAAWLADHPGLLALHPVADELHDEITHVIARVRHVIDRPADKVYAGPCETPDGTGHCPAHLYARPGAKRVACPSCRAEHDVAERRDYMISYAADLRVPAHVALGWTRMLLDKTIPRGTWDSWVSRRRILAHGTDAVGHPVYRFGDVRDLAVAHFSKARHAAA